VLIGESSNIKKNEIVIEIEVGEFDYESKDLSEITKNISSFIVEWNSKKNFNSKNENSSHFFSTELLNKLQVNFNETEIFKTLKNFKIEGKYSLFYL
jgi:glutaredoxin-related protein